VGDFGSALVQLACSVCVSLSGFSVSKRRFLALKINRVPNWIINLLTDLIHSVVQQGKLFEKQTIRQSLYRKQVLFTP